MSWNFFGDGTNDHGVRVGIEEAVKELKFKPRIHCTLRNDCVEIQDLDSTWNCSIKTLNGMCGVMLVFSVNLFRMTQAHMDMLQQLAEWGGYTKIMTTNVRGGYAEDNLRKFGFDIVSDFTNKRTRHNVAIFMRNV